MTRPMTRRTELAAGLIIASLTSGAAFADVDIKTPWANVYVGPGGVFVNGPWGRVDVPASEREQVCAEWRKSTEAYYGERGCTVTFDKDGCVIESLDCPEGK
jgi:hypothetical protein